MATNGWGRNGSGLGGEGGSRGRGYVEGLGTGWLFQLDFGGTVGRGGPLRPVKRVGSLLLHLRSGNKLREKAGEKTSCELVSAAWAMVA